MRQRIIGTGKLRRPIATMALFVAVAAVLALAVAGPLAARPGTMPRAKAFTCVAKVTSVDIAGRTITATVIRSNRAMRASVGHDVVFKVRRFARIIETGPTAITLADLGVGDKLLIRGRVSATGAFRAALVVCRGTTPAVKSAKP